ncbi:MAG: hypothetical protein VX453_11150 [Acidobacteriota bacterium]|nr:hypothetical protein [Acidobacteriota bacterium]
MKRLIVLFVAVVFVLPVMAYGGQGALQVVTINTDDVSGYLSWVESSAPVMAGVFNNPGAIGACVPVQGAEQEGDVFWFSTANSHEAMFSVDPSNPTIANETAKAASLREVRARDIYSILKAGRPLADGATWAAWNLLIKTDEPSRYVAAIADLEDATQANGLEDVTFSAFRINTGEWAGLIMASVAAPTPQRLGALFDSLSEPWAAERLARMSGFREYVRGWTLNCRVYAAQ